MTALTYMQRRKSGIYEFRKMLPLSLAGKPAPAHVRSAFPELVNAKSGRFKREIAISLHTNDPAIAKSLDLKEATRVTDLLAEAARVVAGGRAVGVLSEAVVRDIADEARAAFLAADEEEREEGDDRRRLLTAEERAPWPLLGPLQLAPDAKGMEPDHYVAYGDFLQELAGAYRSAMARRDPTVVEPEVRAALGKRGISLDPSSPERRRLALEVLGATSEAAEAALERHAGKVVPTPLAGEDRGPTLSDAFEAWRRRGDVKGVRGPSPRTLLEAEHAVRRFKELFGDIRLGDVTRQNARDYRDAMAKVPKGLPPKLRKLPIPRLLERKDLGHYPARDAATVNKLLTMLSAITALAEGEGLLDKVRNWTNPFGKGVRFTLDDRDQEREPLSRDELRAIFGSPVYLNGMRPKAGGGEAAFWFPLIGLLSGMRLEEIAGLRMGDLFADEDSGRWFFELSAKGGRALKTASSARVVPVHLELQRIGLASYRQALIDNGAKLEASLWPQLKATAAGRPQSASWSKWFGRWLRQTVGITDRGKVFHSFRHTFKRMARDAGLSEEMHDALTGHAGSGGVGRGYGRGFSLRPLADAMDAIRSPVDLSSVD